MTSLICHQILRFSKSGRIRLPNFKNHGDSAPKLKPPRRYLSTKDKYDTDNKDDNDSEASALVTVKARELLEKEFPEHFHEGKFVGRMSYVDYIDEALARFKELGLEKNLDAYKELLRVFPEGRYHRKEWYDLGLHHAPQQLAGIRIIEQMNANLVKPDKEVEVLVVRAFGKSSEVWNNIARTMYWTMKGRNIDPFPLPETVPEKTYEIAKVALVRMLDDLRSVVTITSTASIPDAIDRTWIVYAQSPLQQEIIERLDKKSILYLEESGLTYVKDKYLTYFTLKVYDDEETVKRKPKKAEPDYDYNTLKMKFYGKPIKEKLESMNEVHHVDDCRILAIGLSGTSSQDSVLSWLKLLQRRNPNLKNLNVVFRFKRPTQDLVSVDEKFDSAKGQ